MRVTRLVVLTIDIYVLVGKLAMRKAHRGMVGVLLVCPTSVGKNMGPHYNLSFCGASDASHKQYIKAVTKVGTNHNRKTWLFLNNVSVACIQR